MKFTCNTKPLSTALDLGIINSNVSTYHKKSNIVQLTIEEGKLKINIETASIKTQIDLNGNSEGEGSSRIFVGSLILKQLISSLDTSTVTLEITDSGLKITSGKSNFTLPKVIDGDEIELDVPSSPAEDATWITNDKASWKFVKDHQLFALAMSYIHPIYTRVWVGDAGDVLVGDMTNALFTRSTLNKLGNTCLLSDTVINLFTCLPDDSRVTKATDGRNYLVSATTEGFTYISEFTPYYESDEGVGSYNSQIFLDAMNNISEGITCKASAIGKVLSQAELLTTTNEDTIKLSVEPGKLTLVDKNVNCTIDVTGESNAYELEFKVVPLKKIITNYGDADITICPHYVDGEISGIKVTDNVLTTLFGGVD